MNRSAASASYYPFQVMRGFLFGRQGDVYYIGGNDILPPPLDSQSEAEILDMLGTPREKEAKSKLTEHNLRLVVYIAKKFDNTGVSVEDLISIGTIGLIKAINTFNPVKNIKLATYASRCIENEILMYFRSNNKNSKNVSLNESVGFDKDGNEITIIDILKAPRPDFLEEIDKKDDIKLLLKYLEVLNDREKEIIIRRYGLYNTPEQTQKVIAKELKISRSYVSRIEKRALTKILREFIKNRSYLK